MQEQSGNDQTHTAMKEEFKTVARFSSVQSAEITAGMLRANGIPAMVLGEASSYPVIKAVIDGIEVKVSADDYEEALKLL